MKQTMPYDLHSAVDTAPGWLSEFLEKGIDWQAAYAFWDWSNDALGHLHMYTAIAALVVGAAVLMRRKGDIAHRLLGLVYIFAMLTTNATALVMYEFTGGPNFFHVAAAVSLITSAGALIAIVIYGATRGRKALETHIELMSWSYFGVALAAIAEVFTRGLGPQIDSLRTFWTLFSVSMAISGVLGAGLVFAYVRSAKRRWFGEPA